MIEVMIAMGLLFMLSLGITDLFSNMQKEQKRQSLIAFLSTKQSQVLSALQNDQSWKNTLSQAASMACLRNNTSCSSPTDYVDPDTSTYETNRASFKIFDGGGVLDPVPISSPTNVLIHGTIPSDITSSGLKGFTESGTPCDSFTTTPAGNDACPIAYRVTWAAEATGINPRIVVFVKMIFNPSDNHQFKQFFNAGPMSTQWNDKYDVKYSRTATTANKAVSIGSRLPPIATGPSCADHGYGVCNGSNYPELRDINDPFELVTYANSNTEFVFDGGGSAVGRYSCTITTFAFMANNVNTILERNDSGTWVDVGNSTTFASWANAGYATNVFNVTFDVATTPKNFRLRQTCSATGSNLNFCALGFRAGGYGSEAWRATINCTSIVD